MREIILAFTFYFWHFSLNAQPQLVNARTLKNIDFIGDDAILKPGINCFVITEWKEYRKFFGTPTQPDTPRFSREMMLVLLMPFTNRDAKLEFNRVDTKAGNFVEVSYRVDLNKGKLTYKFYPIAISVIPRLQGVQRVKFYDGKMKLVKTVEVK
jgi:hypothetical protein